MPRNVPIAGGITIGAPSNWNPAVDGPCGALEVAVDRSDPRKPRLTSAYRITQAEEAALSEGGHLFLSILAEHHPVISMWIQNAAGEPVGDGIQPSDGDMLQAECSDAAWEQSGLVEIGFYALMEELEAQAEQRSNSPTIGDADSVGQVYLSGVFAMKAALSVALEAIGGHLERQRAEQRKSESAGGTVDLPVMTLGAIAAEGQVAAALERAERPLRPADCLLRTNPAARPDGDCPVCIDGARKGCPYDRAAEQAAALGQGKPDAG